MDFAIPADLRVKLKESEKKKKKVPRPCARTEKTMEHEGSGDTNYNWCTRYNPQRIDKGIERIGNKRTGGVHPNQSIFKIGQNIEKSPGNLRKLAVTQTPSEIHQLTLSVINIIKGVK